MTGIDIGISLICSDLVDSEKRGPMMGLAVQGLTQVRALNELMQKPGVAVHAAH